MKQITRISPCVFTKYDEHNNPLYGYNEEIIVGADALRFRNGEGEKAVCVGENTVATAEYSFAAGENSKANGKCSFALGYNVETSNNNSFVCGRYNIPLSGALFAIGCGDSDKNNNAITVYDTCQIDNNISYSAGDTVINGVTAYANGKVEMPGITANADKSLTLTGITILPDGTVDIPKLSQLSNYATKNDVNVIATAHNELSGQYVAYVNSNNQRISTIRTTGTANNGTIKDYAIRTRNANQSGLTEIVSIIVELFKTVGDGIRNGHSSSSWAKNLSNALNNGTETLYDELNAYCNDIEAATSKIATLIDF